RIRKSRVFETPLSAFDTDFDIDDNGESSNRSAGLSLGNNGIWLLSGQRLQRTKSITGENATGVMAQTARAASRFFTGSALQLRLTTWSSRYNFGKTEDGNHQPLCGECNLW